MIFVGDIYDFIDGMAPFHTAMDFDNPGLLVGGRNMSVQSALLSLDITPAVVREAKEVQADLIISHHPVIFRPLKRIDTDTAPYLLAKYDIAAICAHTNLDMAAEGVNTCLAKRLGLKNIHMLKEYGNTGLPEGLVGETEREYSPRAFAEFVRDALGCDGLRYTDGGRAVSKVGLCSGGGADLVYDAAEYGCQAFVTGESKHNILLDAENMRVTMVDAGHFYTEDVVIEPLMEKLQKQFPQVRFAKSKRMHSPAKTIGCTRTGGI
ncbi:Nif3-like dinuclear metal center hexameric protein [Caproiciproducens galactitolivorans]|uniref:GTP cyclohydrolase 1 type 2 homolog n=1 Tax=Caproiciproducens galactitolivorans TaxID=642589 RepID=A0A4Z0XXB0_9FIRM|nr:Nif3-like dinuclear metal center hexameric protein [Caproiciproducens galactitolivorans]QEY33700.1 Nif3-like dinuclear metal center hexameric protein [Caproiciproducens galactitolivorans]TGJ76169.1 putative GTP cyclohydrolase 1 type 2 [Caproiciproducens galactitolivorans]